MPDTDELVSDEEILDAEDRLAAAERGKNRKTQREAVEELSQLRRIWLRQNPTDAAREKGAARLRILREARIALAQLDDSTGGKA